MRHHIIEGYSFYTPVVTTSLSVHRSPPSTVTHTLTFHPNSTKRSMPSARRIYPRFQHSAPTPAHSPHRPVLRVLVGGRHALTMVDSNSVSP